MWKEVTAKMVTEKEWFLNHEKAQKKHKKGLAKKGSFIDNCLIIMKLHHFLMYPSPLFFMSKIKS
jgi:hypothetical protein